MLFIYLFYIKEINIVEKMEKKTHSVHNQEKISKYWNTFKKGDIPIWIRVVTKNGFARAFQNAMYNPDRDDRKRSLITLIKLFHLDFVEYIFQARREIRKDSSFSLTSHKLAVWMKDINPSGYNMFKNGLRTLLITIAFDGNLTEKDIKISICCWIVECMENIFIRL